MTCFRNSDVQFKKDYSKHQSNGSLYCECGNSDIAVVIDVEVSLKNVHPSSSFQCLNTA